MPERDEGDRYERDTQGKQILIDVQPEVADTLQDK